MQVGLDRIRKRYIQAFLVSVRGSGNDKRYASEHVSRRLKARCTVTPEGRERTHLRLRIDLGPTSFAILHGELYIRKVGPLQSNPVVDTATATYCSPYAFDSPPSVLAVTFEPAEARSRVEVHASPLIVLPLPRPPLVSTPRDLDHLPCPPTPTAVRSRLSFF